jgi:DNA-binding transcriptional ArsR family regulator
VLDHGERAAARERPQLELRDCNEERSSRHLCLDIYIDSGEYGGVAEPAVFQVLGEPRRLAILELLRDGERPVGELVDNLGLTQPTVSKHLRVLKEAGLVTVRADAQRRLYRIRPEPLAELDDWLEPYRQLWATHLDRLEDHLDRRRKT